MKIDGWVIWDLHLDKSLCILSPNLKNYNICPFIKRKEDAESLIRERCVGTNSLIVRKATLTVEDGE